MINYLNKATIRKHAYKILIPLVYGSLAVGCSNTKDLTNKKYNIQQISNSKNFTRVNASKRRTAAKISQAKKIAEEKLHKQILNVKGKTETHKLLEIEKLFNIKVPPEIYSILEELRKEAKKELINLGLYYKNITSIDEAKEVLKVYGQIIDTKLPYESTTLISEIYPKLKADCDTKSFLTRALNQSHPKPLPLYYVPLHAHVILRCQFGDPSAPRVYWGTNKNYFNWECTSKDIDKCREDAYYLTAPASVTVDQENSSLYLHNATKNEIISEYLWSIGTELEAPMSIKALKQALKINPKNLLAFNNLAKHHIKNKEYDEAKQYLDKMENLNPHFSWTYHSRAKMLEKQGKHNEALLELNKAIDTFSYQETFFTTRGRIHKELGNTEMAIKDLDKALELDPKEPWPLTYKAMIFEDKKDYSNAELVLKEAIQISEDEDFYRNELAFFYCRQREYTKAKVVLDKTLELYPKNGFAHRLMGKLYLITKKYLLAKQYLEKALDLKNIDSFTLSDLGKANYHLGNSKEASENFKEAYNLDPEDKELYIESILMNNPKIVWPFIQAYYFVGSLFGN